MTTDNNARRVHKILDKFAKGYVIKLEDVDFLRECLPKFPKQKTLEEIIAHVYDVWIGTDGNEWPDDIHGDLETWLADLQIQLEGLKDAPAAVPALPAGMRLADHEEYGRVVVSPATDPLGGYPVFRLTDSYVSGADVIYIKADTLKFIDAEPAPAHPEFLETEEDYSAAPEGTIVACTKHLPWTKHSPWLEGYPDKWFCNGADNGNESMASLEPHRVLRWGNE